MLGLSPLLHLLQPQAHHVLIAVKGCKQAVARNLLLGILIEADLGFMLAGQWPLALLDRNLLAKFEQCVSDARLGSKEIVEGAQRILRLPLHLVLLLQSLKYAIAVLEELHVIA